MAFWQFRNDENNAEDGVLQIDGVLEVEDDWWGPSGQVVARNIRRAIDRSRDLTVYINSPGGDVMAGAEIYTALREHSENGKGKVTVIVSGIAASAASVVAMAGDTVLMSPVAYMMIHNPWSYVSGDAKELRHTADVLDVIAEGIINAYERRTGKSRDELTAMLEAETYMSAQTCVDEGFADGITDGDGDPRRSASPAAKMTTKNFGRTAVLAMLAQHGAQACPGDPREDPREDPDSSADTRRRAMLQATASVQAAEALLP